MLMQDMVNRFNNAKDDRDAKNAQKAKKAQALADAKGEKADVENTIREDEKYLKELRTMCRQKTEEYENRQELRNGEITAIANAVEILGGGSVSGASAKHFGGAMIQVKAHSFAQLRSQKTSPLQKRVAAFLQGRAKLSGSQVLSLAAQNLMDDPFTKVKKMIKDMVTKLMEEANEEAEHKGWCDTELATNQQTRDAKGAEVDKLSSEIEMLGATVTKLSEDITELQAGIAAIDKSVSEATQDRNGEKTKNAATIADSKAAQAAVER